VASKSSSAACGLLVQARAACEACWQARGNRGLRACLWPFVDKPLQGLLAHKRCKQVLKHSCKRCKHWCLHASGHKRRTSVWPRTVADTCLHELAVGLVVLVVLRLATTAAHDYSCSWWADLADLCECNGTAPLLSTQHRISAQLSTWGKSTAC
jgi:hypothetical protein